MTSALGPRAMVLPTSHWLKATVAASSPAPVDFSAVLRREKRRAAAFSLKFMRLPGLSRLSSHWGFGKRAAGAARLASLARTVSQPLSSGSRVGARVVFLSVSNEYVCNRASPLSWFKKHERVSHVRFQNRRARRNRPVCRSGHHARHDRTLRVSGAVFSWPIRGQADCRIDRHSGLDRGEMAAGRNPRFRRSSCGTGLRVRPALDCRRDAAGALGAGGRA